MCPGLAGVQGIAPLRKAVAHRVPVGTMVVLRVREVRSVDDLDVMPVDAAAIRRQSCVDGVPIHQLENALVTNAHHYLGLRRRPSAQRHLPRTLERRCRDATGLACAARGDEVGVDLVRQVASEQGDRPWAVAGPKLGARVEQDESVLQTHDAIVVGRRRVRRATVRIDTESERIVTDLRVIVGIRAAVPLRREARAMARQVLCTRSRPRQRLIERARGPAKVGIDRIEIGDRSAKRHCGCRAEVRLELRPRLR